VSGKITVPVKAMKINLPHRGHLKAAPSLGIARDPEPVEEQGDAREILDIGF
jgi:hypothetical protein